MEWRLSYVSRCELHATERNPSPGPRSRVFLTLPGLVYVATAANPRQVCARGPGGARDYSDSNSHAALDFCWKAAVTAPSACNSCQRGLEALPATHWQTVASAWAPGPGGPPKGGHQSTPACDPQVSEPWAAPVSPPATRAALCLAAPTIAGGHGAHWSAVRLLYSGGHGAHQSALNLLCSGKDAGDTRRSESESLVLSAQGIKRRS
jgi:hypothetical protein